MSVTKAMAVAKAMARRDFVRMTGVWYVLVGGANTSAPISNPTYGNKDCWICGPNFLAVCIGPEVYLKPSGQLALDEEIKQLQAEGLVSNEQNPLFDDPHWIASHAFYNAAGIHERMQEAALLTTEA